jgi:hypothetical protein
MAKPISIEVSMLVRDEIEDVARRVRRSVAFVARRALAAAGRPPLDDVSGARAVLVLRTDEDDPADTASRLRAAAGERPLGAALEASWRAARVRFLQWAEREEAAARAEEAADLDVALRDASDAATSPARLAELAESEYPRVRQLVAQHAATPADARARLANDRERVVRDAVALPTRRVSG